MGIDVVLGLAAQLLGPMGRGQAPDLENIFHPIGQIGLDRDADFLGINPEPDPERANRQLMSTNQRGNEKTGGSCK